MKKLIKSYMCFSPLKYNIIFPILELVIGVVVGLFVAVLSDDMVVTTVAIVGVLMMADMYGDFFVFQGLFSKEYEFGILRNSLKGESVLRLAIIGDQIRRVILNFLVLLPPVLIFKSALYSAGIASNGAEVAALALCLALAEVFAITVGFMITRMVYNFQDGIFAMMLVSLISGGLLFGSVFSILRPGTNPYLWIIVLATLSLIVSFIMIERAISKFRLSFGEKKMGRFGDDSKKKLWIFIAVAFVLNYLMLPLMYMGVKNGQDTSVFVLVQMFYPACAVVLGKLFSYNEGKLPKAFFITIIVTTLLGVFASALSVFAPQTIETAIGSVDLYYNLMTTVVIIVCILSIVLLCVCGKEKRANAGLRFKNPGKSLMFILLYVALFFGRLLVLTIVGCAQEGRIADVFTEFVSMFTYDGVGVMWFNVFLNLPLTFVMFFGEEYGWRYYLQPIMQKKFGVAFGTILLGIVWGVWHIGEDFMFYSTETGVQMLCTQLVTCISYAIFFGYAYMKTKNIWVVTVMHFFNNNMIMVLSGDLSTSSMQGAVVDWSMIPLAIIGFVVFWAFIFTPTMRGKGEPLEEVYKVETFSAPEEAKS